MQINGHDVVPGHAWKTREGRCVRIMEIRQSGVNPVLCYCGRTYDAQGVLFETCFISANPDRLLRPVDKKDGVPVASIKPGFISLNALEATSAPAFLDAAASHMRARASTYDKPEGERSMGLTVDIFNKFHGLSLTEAQGWHLMQILKDVRLFASDEFHRDSAEDCVAYAALKAEAKSKSTTGDA